MSKTGNMTCKDAQQGLTLVELMVGVVVIALMTTLAMPIYESYALRAKTSDATTDMLKIQMAIDRFESDNFRLPDSLQDVGMHDMKDPWGHTYVYQRQENGEETMDARTFAEGQTRVFRNLRLANTGYQLSSAGPLPEGSMCDETCRTKLDGVEQQKQRLTAAI